MQQTDEELIEQYRQGDATAMDELVRRNVDMVYASALRQVRNPHLAEDVTQAVFLIFLRKAASLRRGVVVGGWLCTAARYAATNALKMNARREQRERKAARTEPVASGQASWEEAATDLDAAMGRLSTADRDALALRFLRAMSLREVGMALGIGEDAARKRVTRALDRLRGELVAGGIVIPADSLARLMTTHVGNHAPQAVVQACLAAAQGSSVASATAIAKGAMTAMAGFQVKAAIMAGVLVLGLGGAVTVAALGEKDAPSTVAQSPAAAPATRPAPAATRGDWEHLQAMTYDIQPDGTVVFVSRNQTRNNTRQTWHQDGFRNSDFVTVERMTDEDGQPLEFTTQHQGRMFVYSVPLKKPVKPGEILTLVSEGTMGTLVRPLGNGRFTYRMNHTPGSSRTMRIETHRLPAGAKVIEKEPAELQEQTIDGRVELHIEKLIEPNGSILVRYTYELPAEAAAK